LYKVEIISILLLTSSIVFANIETPAKEFRVKAAHLFSYNTRYIYLLDEQGKEEKAGTMISERKDKLSVFTLRDANEELIGSIEEQYHEQEGWFYFDRIFLLKDKTGEPIGSLTLHFSPTAVGYELFSLDGTRLFHSDQICGLKNVDYLLGNEFANSEFTIWNNLRDTKIEDLSAFENNSELWLQFLLMKAMLYRNHAIAKE
jgi:hypothetical protein